MQNRVEHAVCPLQTAARQAGHPLDDGVAVAVTLGRDGEHERRGGRRDEILPEIRTWLSSTLLFYVFQESIG